jgi:hypothetical protein
MISIFGSSFMRPGANNSVCYGVCASVERLNRSDASIRLRDHVILQANTLIEDRTCLTLASRELELVCMR